ncbi:MAG: amidohydrolase [Planctomycetota bacterium]|nr:amidohydrolase [Planctomycetota bacterium]
MTDSLKAARNLQPRLVELRRKLHSMAELSHKEFNTSNLLKNLCKEQGWKVTENEEFTGFTADIGEGDERVALRADMDALPGKEESGLEFASQTGAAHLCGHDLHMAMCFGAGLVLQEMEDAPPVRLVFQHSEESPPGGALNLITNGALEGVRSIYGLHVEPILDTGKLITRRGPFFSAPDHFSLVIIGRGGHAAAPHEAVDAIYAAANVITASQAAVSRMNSVFEPAVVSFTSVQGGDSFNMLPDRVEMKGTVRTFDKEVRTHVFKSFEKIATDVAAAYGATAEFSELPGYIALKNSEKAVDTGVQAARSLGFEIDDEVKPRMFGEDFSYYTEKVNGAFFMIGAGAGDERWPLHNARVKFDEDVLWRGCAFMARCALADGR